MFCGVGTIVGVGIFMTTGGSLAPSGFALVVANIGDTSGTNPSEIILTHTGSSHLVQLPFSYSIDWGDGTIITGSNNFATPQTFSHTYASDGVAYTITPTITPAAGPAVAVTPATVIIDLPDLTAIVWNTTKDDMRWRTSGLQVVWNAGPPAPNLTCDTAIPLVDGVQAASVHPSVVEDAWYTWQPAVDVLVTFATTNVAYGVSAFTGGCMGLTSVGGLQGSDLPATLLMPADSYLLTFGYPSGNPGSGRLTGTSALAPTVCDNAIPLTDGQSFATTACAASMQVWLAFAAPSNGTITLTTSAGTTVDSAGYGDCGSTTPLVVSGTGPYTIDVLSGQAVKIQCTSPGAAGSIVNVSLAFTTSPLPTDLSGLLWWGDSNQGRFDATSGGSSVTADGAIIKGWAPRAGSISDRLTQATDANAPQYDAVKGAICLPCSQTVQASPFVPNCWFNSTGITLDKQNSSIFFVCNPVTLRGTVDGLQLTHTFALNSDGSFITYYAFGDNGVPANKSYLARGDNSVSVASTTIPIAGRKTIIGFVLTAGGVKCWVNGAYTTATAFGSGTITLAELLGTHLIAWPFEGQLTDVIIYNNAIADADVTATLLAYAQQSRSVVTSFVKYVLCVGDSITQGYGADLNRGWVQNLSLASDVSILATPQGGITLATLYANRAFDLSFFVGGKTNVLVLFAGVNDIGGGATAATTYANESLYVAAAQAAGFKVVVVTTLPGAAGAIAGEFAAYRTLQLANTAGADAVADPIGNATLAAGWSVGVYTYDGVHPLTAGYALIAPIIQAGIQSVI